VNKSFRFHESQDVMQLVVRLARGDCLGHHRGNSLAIDSTVTLRDLSHHIRLGDHTHHGSDVIAHDQEGSMGVG
jgi:hypothetical protein